MEGLKIYDKSAEELARIKKSLGSDTITINFNRLDEQSQSEILKALNDVIHRRSIEVNSVILGVR